MRDPYTGSGCANCSYADEWMYFWDPIPQMDGRGIAQMYGTYNNGSNYMIDANFVRDGFMSIEEYGAKYGQTYQWVPGSIQIDYGSENLGTWFRS